MANNEREQVGNLLKKFTDNRYYFKDSGYYNLDTVEILQQETEQFSIKLYQSEQISKLAFFDKNKEELFTMVQRPSSSIPSFEIYDNKDQRLDYESQSKVLSETKNIIHNFEVFFQKEIENIKERRENAYKEKINTIYQHFNVKQIDNNPPQRLDNDKTYAHGVEHLIKYLYQQSPNYLYEKRSNNDLVYSLKTSFGEIEINFGTHYLSRSQKNVNINFLDEQKTLFFTINGRRDKFMNQENFEHRIYAKDALVNGYEQNVVLASIPTEKIIREIIEIINKDINDYKSGVKKENEELVNKVSQLNNTEVQPEIKEEIKEPIEQITKNAINPEVKEEIPQIKQEKPNKNLILKIREKIFPTNKNKSQNTLD